MALDKQMFEEGTFITNDTALVEVHSVRVLGTVPNRRRIVTVEDVSSLKLYPLTEQELKEYHVLDSAGQKDLTNEERERWVNPTRPGCACPDTLPAGM